MPNGRTINCQKYNDVIMKNLIKGFHVVLIFVLAGVSISLFGVFLYNWNIIAAMGSGMLIWMIKAYITLLDAEDVPPTISGARVVPMYPKEPNMFDKVKSNLTTLFEVPKNSKQLTPPIKD